MFVTQAHHKEVVEQFERRIAELEARIASERSEKDWYRRSFYMHHGMQWPTEKQVNSALSALEPAVPEAPPNFEDPEVRRNFRLDYREWTTADRQTFNEYWVKRAGELNVEPEEIEYRYFEQYGHRPPSVAWK